MVRLWGMPQPSERDKASDGMAYSLEIGVRYLRSKKRATISLITSISIAGVALGVAAQLAVLSITRGLQQQFRDKALAGELTGVVKASW